jgi:hypothetical protein
MPFRRPLEVSARGKGPARPTQRPALLTAWQHFTIQYKALLSPTTAQYVLMQADERNSRFPDISKRAQEAKFNSEHFFGEFIVNTRVALTSF